MNNESIKLIQFFHQRKEENNEIKRNGIIYGLISDPNWIEDFYAVFDVVWAIFIDNPKSV